LYSPSAATAPPWTNLFTGLTLGPGTYYLVLTAPQDQNYNIHRLWGGNIQGPYTYTHDPNASGGEDMLSGAANGGYAPAANIGVLFADAQLYIDVESGPATPEAVSVALMGTGLFALALLRRRK